jgi:hypothetical protein
VASIEGKPFPYINRRLSIDILLSCGLNPEKLKILRDGNLVRKLIVESGVDIGYFNKELTRDLRREIYTATMSEFYRHNKYYSSDTTKIKYDSETKKPPDDSEKSQSDAENVHNMTVLANYPTVNASIEEYLWGEPSDFTHDYVPDDLE